MVSMRSPAFQMYPSDWLGSRAVRLMDAEQRGWYIQLLLESWESEPQATLPNDDAFLRVLAGVNTCSTDVDERWKLVKSMFKTKGKLIYNERLMDEFAKQEVNREKKRVAGHASAESRKAKRETIKAQHLNGRRPRKQNVNTCSTPVELCSPSVPTEAQQKSTLQSSSSIPTSTPEIKKEGRAAKPRDPRLDHPALKATIEVKGSYPNKDTWDLVIKVVGSEPDIERLRECWVAWRSRNYAPGNIGWLTDWYINGIPGGRNGSNRESSTERNARNLRENVEYIRGLSRLSGETDSEDPAGLLSSGS